jgi:hypothetical protein
MPKSPRDTLFEGVLQHTYAQRQRATPPPVDPRVVRQIQLWSALDLLQRHMPGVIDR